LPARSPTPQSHAIELARRAEAAGADALLSVVPYYNKPMQEGMLAHFRTIAASTGLPIILRDIPPRTLRPLADETLARLAEPRQFIGLRDGSGDVSRPMRLSRRLPSGFRLLSGDDVTAFAYIVSGSDGAISQVSNIAPDLCRTIFSNYRQRPTAGSTLPAKAAGAARDLHLHGKSGRSQICVEPARPDVPLYRLPVVELDVSAKAEVARTLAALADEDLTEAVEA